MCPPQFRRQLNRLSALIELADEQFDSIKNVKAVYREELTTPREGVDLAVPVNSDSLIALCNRYFSDRLYSDEHIPSLLDDISSVGYDLKTLIENVELCLPVLDAAEREEAKAGNKTYPMWGFAGLIRIVLDLTDDDYFNRRVRSFPKWMEAARFKYRAKISEIRSSRK